MCAWLLCWAPQQCRNLPSCCPLQKCQSSPQLLPEEPPPPSGACTPFDLLDCLLQQAQQAPAAAEATRAPTAPALLEVPLLPGRQLAAGSSIAPDSLRLQLKQLAAESFEQPADASAGFVSLRQLSDLQADGAMQQHLAAPTPMQLAEPPPAPALPGFLLRPTKSSGDGSTSAVTSPRHSALFLTLEAPVLPTAGAARAAELAVGAPTSAFAHLFEPVAVPDVAVVPFFAPEGCQPASLASLIAQDMLLDDGGLVLPALLMGEEDGREAQSGGCCCCEHVCMQAAQHCALTSPCALNYSSHPCTGHMCVQGWRCCLSSSLNAAASPPAPPTWHSTSTGG